MRNRILVIVLAMVLGGGLLTAVWPSRPQDRAKADGRTVRALGAAHASEQHAGEASPRRNGALSASARKADSPVATGGTSEDGAAEPGLEQDSLGAEEKAVKAFEALTDSLMEPVKGDITLAQIDHFVRKFKALPKERQDEELHHALNLIPDDNSLFLLGVLMDAEVDKEMKELVFNDFLNRADEVKQPMLKAVFKQKSHPCWADAAWILDVTGALPAQKAQ